MDALEILPFLLVHDISLFCLDFSGSGLSQGSHPIAVDLFVLISLSGEYISLGYFEQDDVDVVVKHLRTKDFISRVCLWGSSMGAATALMYAGSERADERVRCLLLDSGFASLLRLAREVVKSQETSMPRWLFKSAASVGLKLVCSSIRKQAGFDPQQNEPVESAARCRVPALLAHALTDQVIPVQHSRDLHAAYASHAKQLVLFAGDHNTLRPAQFFDAAALFLHTHLLTPGDYRFVPRPVTTRGNTELTRVPELSCFLCQLLDEPDAAAGPPSAIVLLCVALDGLVLRAPWSELELLRFRWYEISRYFLAPGDLVCVEYQTAREAGRVVLWTLEAQAVYDEMKLVLRRLKKCYKNAGDSAAATPNARQSLRWQDRNSVPTPATATVPSPGAAPAGSRLSVSRTLVFTSNLSPTPVPTVPVPSQPLDREREQHKLERRARKERKERKEKKKHKKEKKERHKDKKTRKLKEPIQQQQPPPPPPL